LTSAFSATGRVDTPLDAAGVEKVAAELIDKGAELLAICFINGFKNAEHEEAAARIIRKHHPSIPLSLSSEVWPENPRIRADDGYGDECIRPLPKVATYLDRLQGTTQRILG
jgi:N-methylhydantoinase A/oxoprolinase/acetone carboxylase beta subunit